MSVFRLFGPSSVGRMIGCSAAPVDLSSFPKSAGNYTSLLLSEYLFTLTSLKKGKRVKKGLPIFPFIILFNYIYTWLIVTYLNTLLVNSVIEVEGEEEGGGLRGVTSFLAPSL